MLRSTGAALGRIGFDCAHNFVGLSFAAFFTALAATPVLHQRSPQPGKHGRARQRHIQKHP